MDTAEKRVACLQFVAHSAEKTGSVKIQAREDANMWSAKSTRRMGEGVIPLINRWLRYVNHGRPKETVST